MTCRNSGKTLQTCDVTCRQAGHKGGANTKRQATKSVSCCSCGGHMSAGEADKLHLKTVCL